MSLCVYMCARIAKASEPGAMVPSRFSLERFVNLAVVLTYAVNVIICHTQNFTFYGE